MERRIQTFSECVHLGIVPNIGSSGKGTPFQVPIVEPLVPLLVGMHFIDRLHLEFRGNELLFKSVFKVGPSSIVHWVGGKGRINSVAGPISSEGSDFEMGQGSRYSVPFSWEECTIQGVVIV